MARFNPELTCRLAALRQRVRNALSETEARGSAVVEFIFLGVLLLLPVVYLIVVLAQLQGAAYAAAGAADQAGKVFLRDNGQKTAEQRAEEAVVLALQDFGFTPEQGQLQIDCVPVNCQASGTRVTVVVRVRVPLPLIPSLPGVTLSAATMEATSFQIVGRFR